jgi:hypothetical integral membrane protein (TIGR02206 family)
MYLQLFSIVHLFIIFLIPITAWVLANWARKNSKAAKAIRFGLGFVIGLNELAWYGYVIYQGWFSFPYSLPIDLCEIVLWLTVFTLFKIKQWSFDLIYYWGLVGTGMAVLTPDIGAYFPSYISIKFMFAHGCVVLAILFLAWSKRARPSKGSCWNALLWINVYACAMGIFNLIFKTNYFYLCQKPASGSLLDYLGPWPIYLIAGDLIGLILFVLLYLPFRRRQAISN